MDYSYATNPCIRLDRRQQNAWVRGALFHTLENYEISDLDEDAPPPPEDSDPRDLKLLKTHGWIIDEFGLGNLISFLRARVFSAGDEESTINNYRERVGRELTDGEWEKLHSASLMPKLYRMRVLIHSLLSDGIKGQQSAGRFIRTHLHEAHLSRITAVLRMRKIVFDHGCLSKQVDNPKDICRLFFEYVGDTGKTFPTELQGECYRYMIVSGFSEEKASEFASNLVVPPESEWQIVPGVSHSGDFTFRIVHKDDPFNIRIGEINSCCMQIGKNAEDCLVDGMVNPLSSFLVIETDGDPIANSWLRLGKSGILYLDNIEIVGSHQGNVLLANSVTDWAHNLIEDGSYPAVRIGIRYSVIPIDLPVVQMTDELYVSEFGETDIYTDLEKGFWEISV